MKKVLALIMALVLMLSLVACGGSENRNRKENPVETKVVETKDIELTVDNYIKYLTIDIDDMNKLQGNDSIIVDVHLSTPYQKGIPVGDTNVWWAYDEFEGKLVAENWRNNCSFENVVIKGKATITCKVYHLKLDEPLEIESINYEKDFTLECNSSGYATQNIKIELDNEHCSVDKTLDCYANVEVTSISGIVHKKANK